MDDARREAITSDAPEELSESSLPPEIGWSAIEFAEAATDRQAVSTSKVETLGELAARLLLFT